MKSIALIGRGYWGSRARKYTDEFFNTKYYVGRDTDLEEIFADQSLSGVIIATPMETHYAIAITAIKCGLHVMIEKPITLSYPQADELISWANLTQRRVGVDYTFTFSKSIRKMVSLMDKIGTIEYVEMATRHLGRFMDHDVFWLLGSHHLSILGMLANLKGFRFDREEYVSHNSLCTTGALVFDGSMNGRIDVSTNYPGKDMHITVYGSQGTIKWDPQANPVLELTLYRKTRAALPDELIESVWEYTADEDNNLRHAMAYFNDLMDDKVESNAETAALITRILEDGSCI